MASIAHHLQWPYLSLPRIHPNHRTSAWLSSIALFPLRRHTRLQIRAFPLPNDGCISCYLHQVKPARHAIAINVKPKSTLEVSSSIDSPANQRAHDIDEKEEETGLFGQEMSQPYPAWARPVELVAKYFQVDMGIGLGSAEIEEKRSRFGWNELEKSKKKSFWSLFAEQFDDTLVRILLAAAGVSFVLAVTDVEEGKVIGLESFTEPLIILSIIILNAIIGVWQEIKAENTLESLKEMQSEYARVLRGGQEITELPARELVPGDIVELRAGDKVSADMRIAYLKSGNVRLQQASLTGESQPVLKLAEAGLEEDIELQGKLNMVFSGTTVNNGSCVCIVTNTGMATELGKIQAQIQEASLANYDSPLTRKLKEFSDILTKIVGAICIVVWLVNYKYFISFDATNGFPPMIDFDLEQATYYFKVAVALAVAAIPEGLPAVITTCLALGTRRMAEENAIVRKLPSVETLGCTTIICSDKTGTLTTNQMSVVELVAMQDPGKVVSFKVTGTTYNPADGEVLKLPDFLDCNFELLSQVCTLCNDAGIQFKNGSFTASGMPTEAALLVLVEKMGLRNKSLQSKFVAGQKPKAENRSLRLHILLSTSGETCKTCHCNKCEAQIYLGSLKLN